MELAYKDASSTALFFMALQAYFKVMPLPGRLLRGQCFPLLCQFGRVFLSGLQALGHSFGGGIVVAVQTPPPHTIMRREAVFYVRKPIG